AETSVVLPGDGGWPTQPARGRVLGKAEGSEQAWTRHRGRLHAQAVVHRLRRAQVQAALRCFEDGACQGLTQNSVLICRKRVPALLVHQRGKWRRESLN